MFKFKKKLLFSFLTIGFFCTINTKETTSLALTKKDCLEKIGDLTLQKSTVDTYFKEIHNDFDSFENEIKTLIKNSKENVSKLGGETQPQFYKKYALLQKNLNDNFKEKLSSLEKELNRYIYLLIMIEDCHFNKILTDDEYNNLFNLND